MSCCPTEEKYGYEDSRFEKAVDAHFHCSICYNVLKEPMMCRNNEHIFCRGCITEHLTVNSHTCPECNEDLTIETLRRAPRVLTNYLSELKIKCDYSHRDCQQFVRLEELDSHVENCGFAPLSNDECEMVVNKQEIIHHESAVCEYRKVKCHKCVKIEQDMEGMNEKMEGMEEKMEWKMVGMEEKMDGVNRKILKKIEGMEEKMDGMIQKMDGIEEKMEGMEEKMEGINRKVVGMKKKMEGMNEKMDGMEEKMEGMGEQMEGMEEKLEGMNKKIQGMKKKVERMNEKMEGVEEKINGMEEKVEGMEEKVEGMEEKMKGINKKMQGMKDTMEEKMEGLASKEDVDEIKALMVQMFEKFSLLKNTIQNSSASNHASDTSVEVEVTDESDSDW